MKQVVLACTATQHEYVFEFYTLILPKSRYVLEVKEKHRIVVVATRPTHPVIQAVIQYSYLVYNTYI